MKKNLFSMLVISVLALAFVGCTNPAGGNNAGGNNAGGNNAGGNNAGGNNAGGSTGGSSYSANYAVGDIILNDGTKVNYETAKTFTGSDLDGLKSKAIAVIFRANTASKKALGVGLKHNRSGLAWCTRDAKASDKDIETIQCRRPSGSDGNLTFTDADDTDGSDNLEQIASFLKTENDTTGTDADKRYPAFYFAKNYKTTATNLTSAYENGWYLPTVAELFDIWKVKATVDAASSLCGGSQFGTSPYWSSSQYPSYDDLAYLLEFSLGGWSTNDKHYRYGNFCAVRAFN